jgi:hypothetical protein
MNVFIAHYVLENFLLHIKERVILKTTWKQLNIGVLLMLLLQQT